jgi:predicted DNA-binding transcriptional regulator YafY
MARPKKIASGSLRDLAGSRVTRPPFLRMLRIHEHLSADRAPNCSVLAREFEVSVKTVQRDVDFMRDQLMLPIEYDSRGHGFFYSRPVGQFPLITVSEGEVVALLVAQKAAEQYRGTSFEKPLQSAFQKLVSSLTGETNISLHELSEAVSFHSAGVPNSQIKVIELLTEAVVSTRVVEFDYFSLRASKPELRQVAPYHLACINNQWYLIGADRSRGQLRTFALTRVANVKNLKIPFARPTDFSVAKMLAGSFAAFQAARTEHVKIRFDAFAARLVRERQWHKSQKMRPAADGGMELAMRVGIAPDLENWILSWGDHAEVMEPLELRRRICTTIRNMATKYQMTAG